MNRPVEHIEETDREHAVTEDREEQLEAFQEDPKAPEDRKLSKEASAPIGETAQETEGPGMPSVPGEQPSQERAGAILKREREAQGIPLDIVHEATKIPMDALRAIEEGYEVRMLSPFYYKGFVKMYAGYLGLDVSMVIDDYREEELPKHIDKNVEEFELPAWISQAFTRRRKQQAVVIIGGLLALFLLVKIAGFIGGLFTRRPPAEKAPAKIQTVKTEAKKTAEAITTGAQQALPKITVPREIPKVEPRVRPVPTPVPTTAPDPVAAAHAPTPVPVAVIAKDIVLTVRAKQNCWLRVRTDGNTVFQSTLRTGAVETWTADREIEISGKNITQLEFELNGKMIGSLGRKDHNAKRIVVTKDGLSVGD